MYHIKQSASIDLAFFAHDVAGDAVTGMVDGGFTKRISKNGAAFGAMTVTITEAENGWYFFTLSASHSDTLGVLSITFTNAACKQVNLQFRVEETNLDVNVASINDSTAAAVRLALSAGQIIPFTVDDSVNTPTTLYFEADDITEADTNHYQGRLILWTTGNLTGQMTRITSYLLVGANGAFNVNTLTEAPANNDTGVIM
jgi:hypothetical protein